MIGTAAVGLAHRRLFAEITFGLVDQRTPSRAARPLGAGVAAPWPAPAHRDRIDQRWPGAGFDAAGCSMTAARFRQWGRMSTADGALIAE